MYSSSSDNEKEVDMESNEENHNYNRNGRIHFTKEVKEVIDKVRKNTCYLIFSYIVHNKFMYFV